MKEQEIRKAIEERCLAVKISWKPFFRQVIHSAQNRKLQDTIREINNYFILSRDRGLIDKLQERDIFPGWDDYIPVFIRFKYNGKSDRIAYKIGADILPANKNFLQIRTQGGHWFGGYCEGDKDLKAELIAENILGEMQIKPTDSHDEGVYTDYYLDYTEDSLDQMLSSQAPNLLHAQALDFGPDLYSSLLFLEKLLKTPVKKIKHNTEEQVRETKESYWLIMNNLKKYLSTQRRSKFYISPHYDDGNFGAPVL